MLPASAGKMFTLSTAHQTRFLFWTYNSTDINMYFSAQSVTLNDLVYAYVLQAVIEKLGANAVKYVTDIQIG